MTRLIAAGLRSAGIRTLAKTTGTLPRLILPDGCELAIRRGSSPHVLEQLHTVSLAAEMRCQALVLECMAVQPELQWLSERHLVRATHGVITNVRADHLDAMGPTIHEVGLALAGMVPRNGALFTAEPNHFESLQRAARDRSSRWTHVTAEQWAGIGPERLAGFRYIEHPENVALALAVCAALGIDQATALAGMWSCQPDPGALTVHRFDLDGFPVTFFNGFAANDPESTEWLWNWAIRMAAPFPESSNPPLRRVLVVNCRRDRIERSLQLAEACAQWTPADAYLVVGSGTQAFLRRAIRGGVEPADIEALEERPLEEIVARIAQRSQPEGVVVGIGNIGGIGLELAAHFQQRESVVGHHAPATEVAA